jgi:hypothetical protein
MTDTFEGNRMVQHSGSWSGYRNWVMRLIDKPMTVIVLTNGVTATEKNFWTQDSDARWIVRAVMKEALR